MEFSELKSQPTPSLLFTINSPIPKLQEIWCFVMKSLLKRPENDFFMVLVFAENKNFIFRKQMVAMLIIREPFSSTLLLLLNNL